jgi:hypothetical protein
VVICEVDAPDAGEFEPQVEVLLPDGTVVCEQENAWLVEVICPLQDAGDYGLIITDGHTGLYRVYLQRLNNPGLATPLPFGETMTNTITLKGQFHTYTFDARADEVIDITIVQGKPIPNKPQIEPWFAVYQPNGEAVAGCTHSDWKVETTCTIPRDGTYTMLIADGSRQGMGEYRIFLRKAQQ